MQVHQQILAAILSGAEQTCFSCFRGETCALPGPGLPSVKT
jgi:hypothetical protein